MWMTQYITEIQQQLIKVYGFKAGANGCPQKVPDGEYPMKIEGKTDYLRIVKGKISCCNWKRQGKAGRKTPRVGKKANENKISDRGGMA